jgi:hypothetical protein
MVIRNKLKDLALTLVLILFGGCFSQSWAQSDSPLILDTNRIRWSHLIYSAKSIWADVEVDVRLEPQSKAKMQAELPANRQGDAIPVPDAGGYRMTTDIVTDVAFKSPVHKKNHIWFIPHDGTALGRLRLRLGKDDFKKIYRFTRQGVFRHRQEPKNKQEALLKPEKWTDILDTFYSYSPTQPGCANVTDRLLLVYIASAAGIQASSQPLSVCVFGKRTLFRVRLKAAGKQSIKSEFTEINQKTETRRQGKINALKIDLEVQQLASELGIDENFSFLGLRENISVLIEPGTNLPIQIRGDIPSVGKAVLNLQSARIE